MSFHLEINRNVVNIGILDIICIYVYMYIYLYIYKHIFVRVFDKNVYGVYIYIFFFSNSMFFNMA